MSLEYRSLGLSTIKNGGSDTTERYRAAVPIACAQVWLYAVKII